MKKICLILSFVLILSLTGCGNNKNDKEAFNLSKDAYDCISEAYGLINRYGDAIYETWRLSIYESDKMSISFLSEKLGISRDELYEGAFRASADYLDKGVDELKMEVGWDPSDNATNKEIRNELLVAMYIDLYGDNQYSAYVAIVSAAYKENGTTAKIDENIKKAKTLMKSLSELYSDYDHYPILKKYYTSTKAYYDFCISPEGSFEQIKDTKKDYENDIREYKSDLEYIFGDDDFDDDTEEEANDINSDNETSENEDDSEDL